jgi:hypothetical protein
MIIKQEMVFYKEIENLLKEKWSSIRENSIMIYLKWIELSKIGVDDVGVENKDIPNIVTVVCALWTRQWEAF